MQPGRPRSNSQNQRNNRAFLVADDPSKWYAKCCNCLHNDFARSPGRPSKYNDEERKWNRANYPKVYKANVLRQVLQSYGPGGAWPLCSQCYQPATRTLYIGEFGQAPVGNHSFRCRRLALTDPYWHNQFAPYCDAHENMNIGQRKAYKDKLHNERLAETTYKAERSFTDLQRAGEV